MTAKSLSIGECAAKTGLSVRTLRYWEQRGLLKPLRRADSSHRVFVAKDLERVHQIVILKKLGVKLSRISHFLEDEGIDLARLLEVQLMALQRRRHEAAEAIAMIEHVIRRAADGEVLGLETLCDLVRTASEEEEDVEAYEEIWPKYFSEEQIGKIEKRAEGVSQKQQNSYAAMWQDLIADIEKAASDRLDASGSVAKALLSRYRGLIATFTQGDPETEESMRKMYADQANWPKQPKPHFTDKAMAFLKVVAAEHEAG